MKRFALIQGGKVSNVVAQEGQPDLPGQWIDITGQHIGPGFTYDGNGVFSESSSKDENNKPILAQIAALEAGQMRGIRECLLTGDKTGLQLVDDKVKALRAKLEK